MMQMWCAQLDTTNIQHKALNLSDPIKSHITFMTKSFCYGLYWAQQSAREKTLSSENIYPGDKSHHNVSGKRGIFLYTWSAKPTSFSWSSWLTRSSWKPLHAWWSLLTLGPWSPWPTWLPRRSCNGSCWDRLAWNLVQDWVISGHMTCQEKNVIVFNLQWRIWFSEIWKEHWQVLKAVACRAGELQ